MKYKSATDGTLTVIELSGDIDLQTSPDARAQILALLSGGRQVLVNMAAVEYIDSSGIASLVEALQFARNHDLVFALADISEASRQVFELARLDKVFTVYNTVEDARAAIA